MNSSFRYLLEARTDAIVLHPFRYCFSIKFGKTWKLKYHFHDFAVFCYQVKGCQQVQYMELLSKDLQGTIISSTLCHGKVQEVPRFSLGVLASWHHGFVAMDTSRCYLFFRACQGESQDEVWMEWSSFSIQQVSQLVKAQNPDVRSKGKPLSSIGIKLKRCGHLPRTR